MSDTDESESTTEEKSDGQNYNENNGDGKEEIPFHKKGYEVEVYSPEKFTVRIPDGTQKIEKNDKCIIEIHKVTLADGTLITDEKESLTLYAGIIDEDPDCEIRGINLALVKQKLGEFLRITCYPNFHYNEEKRNILGIEENEVVIFEIWIKSHDPFMKNDPQCCSIL